MPPGCDLSGGGEITDVTPGGTLHTDTSRKLQRAPACISWDICAAEKGPLW